MILHELFRVVSRFPRYISCYIVESQLPFGQCVTWKNMLEEMEKRKENEATRLADRKAEKEGRQAGSQVARQAGRQTDRQTDRQAAR